MKSHRAKWTRFHFLSPAGIFPVLCFICVVCVKYRRDCRECWAHHKKYSGGKGFTPAFTGRSIPPPPPRPYVTQHNKISSGGSISGGISGTVWVVSLTFMSVVMLVFLFVLLLVFLFVCVCARAFVRALVFRSRLCSCLWLSLSVYLWRKWSW